MGPRLLSRIVSAAILVGVVITGAYGDEPSGEGLSALYPGDVGIAAHPSVVFVEDYEESSLAELLARWEESANTDRISFSTDVPARSGGSQSILFHGTAHSYRRILPGYDKVYFRYYVKYAADSVEEHHSVWMGGHNPSTAWPWPRAGQRPDGAGWWSTGVEPMGSSWAWDWPRLERHPHPDAVDQRRLDRRG